MEEEQKNQSLEKTYMIIGGDMVIGNIFLEESTHLKWLKEKSIQEGNGCNYYQVLDGAFEGALIQISPTDPLHSLII